MCFMLLWLPGNFSLGVSFSQGCSQQLLGRESSKDSPELDVQDGVVTRLAVDVGCWLGA